MKNPCKDCPRKGCGVYHDQCPEYQTYRKEKEENYEVRKRVSQEYYDYNHMIFKQWKRKMDNKPK